ncbi:protein GAST1 [Eucalyptus grandis]|uniref:Uncharacterized protein n=3 Tax=Eucalyptus TaxID=3932 RepID=A0ACC3LXD7_EUCGR|nr:protein GAST1 [Eucalyptus grandis]KAK3443604.1 hypothetical protein EUGRSUZ_B03715 [Eucalyptus grandis]
MAKAQSILLLCVALLLVLAQENEVFGSTESVPEFDVQARKGSHQTYGTTQGSLKPQDCGPRCTSRCSATSYKKPCLFFCQKCCAKCLCVPAGTYGNKQTCPCYNNWKTKRGGPKCP